MISSIFRRLKRKILHSAIAEPRASTGFNQLWTSYVDPIPGWLSRSEAQLLWELSSRVHPERGIVEIGSYEGRSTVALATGSKGAQVFAIDPHTGDISEVEKGLSVDTWLRFQENVARCGVADLVVAIRDTSVSAAAQYTGPPVQLLFIDGWHSTEAVEADIEGWSQHLAAQSSVVIDDWTSPPVAAGILNRQYLLPKMVGAIGKDLVFSNDPRMKSLATIRAAERGTLLTNPYKLMQNAVASQDPE